MKWEAEVVCEYFDTVAYVKLTTSLVYGSRENVIGAILRAGVFTSEDREAREQTYYPAHTIRRITLTRVDDEKRR